MMSRPHGFRRPPLPALIGLVVALLAVGFVSLRNRAPGGPDKDVRSRASAACPWLDSSQPVATRVDELLKAMTPLEEATMLHLRQIDAVVPFEGYTPAIPRLCIPVLTEQDGAAGVATGATNVTQLPAPIADAAAFDPTLAARYGDVIGAEDAVKGVDLALSPTVNIDRSPLWGRSYETLGEDPYLSASLAAPLVEGIQANRVVSVVKHFAVYNQESFRSTAADDAVVSEQAMREIYLPAFSAVVQQAHAGAIMCSYNLINGIPACEDASLIQHTLRQDWHFAGFVRSDCNSIYQQAPAMAVGVSQAKCTRLYDPVALAGAVTSGQLPRSELDGLARPLLSVLFAYDLIGAPHPEGLDDLATSPAHRQVALATDDEGAVLLKNAGRLLPLDLGRIGSVALIGGSGGTPMPAGFGAMHVLPSHPVTALAALRSVLGLRLRYDNGNDPAAAAALARTSQVAVVVVHDVEAERSDRTSLALNGDQNALVAAVAAANPRTIVVLETGSAVVMPWLSAVPSVLETWYPGELAGTSLVDLLSGRVNPSGKLPVSFPVSAAAMPDNTARTFGGVGGQTLYSDGIDVGYRWYQTSGVAPLFPFGFGLSYTTFGFGDLAVAPRPGGGLSVGATVTNTGDRAGADVVQCYLGDPPTTGEPPRQLRGFTRVSLDPGRSTRVHFDLPPGDLATWDSTGRTWTVTAGTYRVYVGDGSAPTSLPLSGSAAVGAATLGAASGPAPA